MDYTTNLLANSLRTVYKPAENESKISHFCLLINSGSRDELDFETGMAHFTEHMLFKGTTRRSTVQLLKRLEVAGGELNAFTTKEYTCVYASFLNEHLERAMELISDMAFNSIFPEAEIDREKGVIADEIESYQDVPEELIQDEFDELLFQNDPLGKCILGTRESITSFNRNHFLDYMARHYVPANMTIGLSTALPEKKFRHYAEKYFGSANAGTVPGRTPVKALDLVLSKRVAKPISQVHAMIGRRACSIHDSQRMTMMLINNLLGGPGMSSVLNLEIREKKGICYTIESGYSGYRDSGIFSVYFGTEAAKAEKCLALVHKELKLLKTQALSGMNLHQAKQRFKGQIALAEESRSSVLISICKSILDFGKADPIPVLFEYIDAITSKEILELSVNMFDPKDLFSLVFEPSEN